MSVKKAYVSIIQFLTVNQDKKVKTILDELIEMCTAKSAGSSATTVHRDENGAVQFIRCGYFKQWLPTALVEFGLKANSASGFNPMCKEGYSLWTRKQRVAKAAREALLEDVSTGAVDVSSIASMLADIEAARVSVESHPLGFTELEEIVAMTDEDWDALIANLSDVEVAPASEAEAEAEA